MNNIGYMQTVDNKTLGAHDAFKQQYQPVCPQCGYCPHCGRGGQGVSPLFSYTYGYNPTLASNIPYNQPTFWRYSV